MWVEFRTPRPRLPKRFRLLGRAPMTMRMQPGSTRATGRATVERSVCQHPALHQHGGEFCGTAFTGTKFTLLFTRDFNRGVLDVFVDGNKIATIDGYLGAFAFQQLYTSPSFPNGTHTVRLVFTGGRPYFDIDAIQIFGVPVTVTAGTYDDGHAAWRYSGGWASYTGNGPYGNTLHYNGTAGNYAELTFTGTKFTLLFTKDSNRGSMDLYVDGNKVTTINAYSPTYAYQQTYTSPTFASGTHTVYVVHAGTGPYIDVDAITILP